MSFPWATFYWQKILNTLRMEGDDDLMSDIMFLAMKEFGGKLRENEGNVTAAGDIATLTANTGKDMYLARAKICWYVNPVTGFNVGDEVVLKINGTVVETAKFSYLGGSSGSGVGSQEYEFKNIGHKVAAGEIIKLEAITVDTDVEIEGFIECFEEDTGETPRLAAQTQGTATITGGIAGSLGFIAKKEFQGKTRQADGVLATTGDICTLTATSGKDMYLAKAKVSIRWDNSAAGALTRATVDLVVNGVVVEQCYLQSVFSTGMIDANQNYEFAIQGIKVAATQIIKLEVSAHSGGSGSITGVIRVFEETTGADPTA